MVNSFTRKLKFWHENQNKRIMPWKGEKDAYKIWVSEIILQQTRVEQGLSYYNNFITTYPTLSSLALAQDNEVFKLWEGLGYYSRCKNLLLTARHIHYNLGGKFPENYDDLLKLKGIGPYTAAAIASFAYSLPYAVVDGNVFRVLSRFTGNFIAIDSTAGKHVFTELANQVLDKKNSGEYNQAIMDFGATICKPQLPLCATCFLKTNCKAYAEGWVNQLPVKEKRIVRTKRWLYYFVFVFNGQLLIRKREQKDIWENLHEFYLFESDKAITGKEVELAKTIGEQLGIPEINIRQISQVYTQQLTHQTIAGQFLVIDIYSLPRSLSHFKAVTKGQLKIVAFPRMLNLFLDDLLLNEGVM